MPSVRSMASKHYALLVLIIILFGEIIFLYFCYTKKKSLCIIIAALSNYQPSFYIKCTKSNIYSSCDI